MNRICSEFQDQVLIWFLEGIKSAEADFLSERVINYWNNLPNHVKLSTSVDSFVAWKRISQPT